MKKKVRLFTLIAIILISFISAQSETIQVVPSITGFIRYEDSEDIVTFGQDGSIDIGRYDENSYEICYRTRYVFSLSEVPDGSKINSVKITFSIAYGCTSIYKAKFVKLPDSFYGVNPTSWAQFTGSGTVYASNLSYNQDYPNKVYAQLTADVESATAINGDDILCIGFMSENESTNPSYANVYVNYIDIDYSPRVSVTVQNNFTGGKIYVDGVEKDSPWTSSTGSESIWYKDESHTIRAYTQEIDGLTYPFPEPGTWIVDGTQRTQINNITAIPIAPDDDWICTAYFGDPGYEVMVYQKKSDGTSTGGTIGRWEGGPDFKDYFVPKTFVFPPSSVQALQGKQDIVSGEKYNYWKIRDDIENDVNNHHVFSIGQNFSDELTIQFNEVTEGIAIASEGGVEFKDPWFIDYADPNYGNHYRNRGSDAIFRTRTSPFTIDYSTAYENGQPYQGVFLNQNEEFDDEVPIYSIRTSPLFDEGGGEYTAFCKWVGKDASGVENSSLVSFSNQNKSVTDVVFKNNLHTVEAKYTSVTVDPAHVSITSENNDLFLNADYAYSTTDGIYEFAGWDGINVTFTNQSSPKTKVVFSAGAEVGAVYEKVNDNVNYTLSIPSGKILTIPAGANIQFADGFTFDVDGTLEIEGTPAQPITLYSEGCSETSPYAYYELNDPDDILINVDNPSANLVIENAKIHDTYCGVSLKASNQNVIIRNVEIYNTNIGVEAKDLTNAALVLDSVYIHDTDIGVAADDIFPDINQKSQLVIMYSIFADNDCDFYLIPSEEITASSDLYLTILNCDFYNSVKAIIINEQPSGSSFGETIFDIVNSIFCETEITVDGDSYLKGETGDNILYNTNISIIIANPITSNPCFVDPNNGDFRLGINSSGIDQAFYFNIPSTTGTPPDHFEYDQEETDPDGTEIDIGALYYPQTTFSGTIDSDTTWFGTINVTGNVTISSGAKLTIEPYTMVKFDDDTGIRVYGILQADGDESSSITFTSSNATPFKGDWDYIRFENSSIDDSCYIKNCIIEYGYYGIICYYAEPSIQFNTISNCTRGVYFYYTSPTDFETNYITQNTYGIYGVNSSPTITDNLIKGNSSRGCYFYSNCAPKFFDNTFDSNYYGAYFYYSNPEFGPTEGSGKGNNILKNGTVGIRSYNSDPFLGTSDGYNTRVGGYNEICSNTSYNVYAQSSSDVEAQWCWWGEFEPGDPPPNIYSDASSTINYNNFLSNPTGGGSSLAKSTAGVIQSISNVNFIYLEAGFDPKKPNPNKLSDLWLWGHDLSINGKHEDAIEVYQKLISKFSNDDLAKKALVKLYHLYTKTGEEGFDNYLNRLISNSKISDNIRPTVYSLMMSYCIADNYIENAIDIGEKIIDKYPDTEEEKMTLFSFVLLAVNDLNNTEMASKYLSTMKQKYPTDELTLMAREAMGEKINWALMKPTIEPETVEIVLPEKYALHNNYPNPFNPRTTIAFDLPEESHMTLIIYDISGREVVRLVDRNLHEGFRHAVWDGKDKSGIQVSSGVYLYSIRTSSGFNATKKMVLVR